MPTLSLVPLKKTENIFSKKIAGEKDIFEEQEIQGGPETYTDVPKVELQISTPLQIEVLNEISAWLNLQTNRTTFRGGLNQKHFISDFQY